MTKRKIPQASFCNDCGPNVMVDGYGCCAGCGGNAMGPWADEASALFAKTKRKEKPLRVEWWVQRRTHEESVYWEKYLDGIKTKKSAVYITNKQLTLYKERELWRAVRVEIYAVPKKGKR